MILMLITLITQSNKLYEAIRQLKKEVSSRPDSIHAFIVREN